MEIQLEEFQLFQPPILSGIETSEDCENWFDDIEILFDVLDCTDEQKG